MFHARVSREECFTHRRKWLARRTLLDGSSRTSRDSFPLGELHRTVCHARCIHFTPPSLPQRNRTLLFFPACFAQRVHPRASLILQNGIADGAAGSRAAQESCPRCTIVSIPSAFRMIHRCQGFTVAGNNSSDSSTNNSSSSCCRRYSMRAHTHKRRRVCVCVCVSLKNADCNNEVTPRTRRDIRAQRKQSVTSGNCAIA